jgi:hypothetical protein
MSVSVSSVSFDTSFSVDEVWGRLVAGDAWGDIQYDCYGDGPVATLSEPVAKPEPEYVPMTFEEEALDGYKVPDLRLRKNIWETYPVNLHQIRRTFADGADRYSIVWDEDRVEEWREMCSKATTWDHHQDYEFWEETRLLHALNKHSHKYIVEPARHDGEICVIAMVFTPREEGSNSSSSTAVATVASKPNMKERALQVLNRFPVAWKRDGAIHSIEVHGVKMSERVVNFKRMSAEQQRPHVEKLRRDLTAALSLCDDCVVTPSSTYLCVVRILSPLTK